LKKIILIFSGYNIRAVIAFIRTLESNNVEYAIIAKSSSDDIFNTIYSDKIKSIRNKIELDLDDMSVSIEQVRKKVKFDICMIAPSTEALNRFILQNNKYFENINCFIPLVTQSLYECISDKYSFGLLCHKYGIRTPNELTAVSFENLPLVAKPKKYLSNNNEIFTPIFINSKTELENFNSIYDSKDFYYQNYVNGKSIYLLYYFDENQKVFKFSQENLIQQEAGKSMIYSKASDIHNKEISSEFEKLFVKEKFRGLVMIELKLENDMYYMIEANPRFWGPSQLFVDSNYNFFEAMLYDYLYIQEYKGDQIKMNSKYFWDDGISSNIDIRNNIAFYDYSKDDFIEEMDYLRSIEIFNRSDTKLLYKGK
jgi:predicted ATP-grasp superfamily ATP-dependent carboligase